MDDFMATHIAVYFMQTETGFAVGNIEVTCERLDLAGFMAIGEGIMDHLKIKEVPAILSLIPLEQSMPQAPKTPEPPAA